MHENFITTMNKYKNYIIIILQNQIIHIKPVILIKKMQNEI